MTISNRLYRISPLSTCVCMHVGMHTCNHVLMCLFVVLTSCFLTFGLCFVALRSAGSGAERLSTACLPMVSPYSRVLL